MLIPPHFCYLNKPFKSKEAVKDIWLGSPNSENQNNAIHTSFNPIQDVRGGKKALSTSFFPATSTSVWISPQNVLTFSFNFFLSPVLNFKAIPSANPKLLNMTQAYPQKNVFSGQILIKLLLCFSYRNARAKLWSNDPICNIIRITQ